MLRIEAYSEEILEIENNSIHEVEIIKEWIKEELVGIKPLYEIESITQEVLALKDKENMTVWHNNKQLLTIQKTA